MRKEVSEGFLDTVGLLNFQSKYEDILFYADQNNCSKYPCYNLVYDIKSIFFSHKLTTLNNEKIFLFIL